MFRMMHNFILTTVWIAALACAVPTGADYDAGQRAWEEKRYSDALTEWQRAADENDARAMLKLGQLYVQGLGILQDYVLAHMWFNLAASRGEVEAIKEREALVAKMTAVERVEAQKLARTWRPGKADQNTAQKSDIVPQTVRAAEITPVTEDVGPPPPQAILEAQSLLAVLGYKPGPADGIWGGLSERAYQEFLRDVGLTPTDSLTPWTLRQMRTLAKRQGVYAKVKATIASSRGQDAVFRNTKAGDVNRLKAALAAGVPIDARDAKGWTPLMHAADKGNSILVEYLLQSKADPNIRAADGETALFIAAVRGHLEIIAALMKAGADPTITGARGKTAVEIARTKFGEPDDYYKLRIYDGDTGKSKKPTDAVRAVHRLLEGYEPLFYIAAWNEDPSFLTRLLDSGTDVNARDKDYFTLLHHASRSNENPAVAALLLDRGANINIPDKDKLTPLHHAAAHNENPAVTALLLDRGVNVDMRDEDYNTPLHHASRSNENPAVTALLLDRGANVDTRGKDMLTPLHHAASDNANPAVAALLLDRGANINVRDKYANDRTPLHYATATNKNPAVTALLLDRGANINVRDKEDNTPLHQAAAHNKNPAVTALLLDRGANINVRDKEDNTPLHQAAAHNKNPAVTALLLDRGANINTTNKYDNTSLHLAAAENENPAVAALLLDRGANINTTNKYDNTSLHLAAAENENPAVAALLLDRGANINARDKTYGSTPLHYAAGSNANPAVAALLLDRGTNINVRNSRNETPLDYAIFKKNPVMEELIRRRGGTQ